MLYACSFVNRFNVPFSGALGGEYISDFARNAAAFEHGKTNEVHNNDTNIVRDVIEDWMVLIIGYDKIRVMIQKIALINETETNISG